MGVVPSGPKPLSEAEASKLESLLSARARELARGAALAPEGQLLGGNFQKGHSLVDTIQIRPDQCYTLIAVAPAATEVEIELDGHEDTDTGAEATLGKPPHCLHWESPHEAKLVLRVSQGSSIAALRVYVTPR